MKLVSMEDLRQFCGLDPTDISQDGIIDTAYEMALAVVETYLDRKLERGGQYEEFVPVNNSFQLIRYPVDPHASNLFVDEFGNHIDPQPDYKMDVDYTKGIVHFKGKAPTDLVRVEYIGGYVESTLPKALGMAIARVVRIIYFDLINPAPVDLGGVKRVTVPDVGTIEYSEAGSGADLMDNPYLDGGAMVLLDPFRRIVA